MTDEQDWRLTNQATYLSGVALSWRRWFSSRPPDAGGEWEHDHCEFCWVHFGDHVFADDPDTQLAGYTTADGHHWICSRCFDDFKDRFRWQVAASPE